MKRLGLLVAATIGSSALLAAPAAAQSEISLILGQSAVTSNEAFNVFVPLHLGYFKDEGVKLEYQTSQGGTQVVQLLSAGKADVGLAAVPGVILGRQQGIPVVAVYNYLRRHATALAVLAGGPIKTPADLKGKIIGVVSMSATRTYDGRAMIKAAGLDPDKDVQWVPVGFGAQAAAALIRGQVAALALWDATYVDMQNQGVNLKFFVFPFQEDLVGYVYVTTDAKMGAKRNDLVKFLRAVTKGTVFAIANPEAAACIYLTASGDIRQAKDKNKALQDATNVVKDNVKNALRSNPNQLWGGFPPNSWATNTKYYQELGVVKGDLPPVNSMFVGDDSFFKEISKFDSAKIEEQAKSYKCQL
ncbi:MAG TPA: ABC transporter substrate-binding protein [Xanthobacteraceae bacterium]|jgi:NitT/TauT family transport system substrate-binding protein